MMTRSKKKSTAEKDKNCFKKPNTKYSTVPVNNVVEVGEMGVMDQDRPSGGLDDDCHRMDYLQVAWLLREKLNDLVDGDRGEFPGLRLQSLLDMAISCNIVFVDPKMLNPLLWRTLPKDLLLLILAYLPLPDINRMHSLSREWNRDMGTVNSVINRACDTASPNMVAFFSQSGGHGDCKRSYLVTICTQRSQYSYRFHLGVLNIYKDEWDDMGACDGGLICFVSTWRPNKSNPMCIIVVNILTRVQHKLPPLQYAYTVPPKMMHIEVDSKTKCYRVVVVGKNRKGHPTIEIYHSDARQWTKATPPLDSIFGLAYKWEHNNHFHCFKLFSQTPSMYDFIGGQLKHFDENDYSVGAFVITFWKDCKFVLHKNTSNGEILHAEGYCISKYRSLNNSKDWLQERSYLCSPFEDLFREFQGSEWSLKACEGFLMMYTLSLSRQSTHCWLLDLTSGEWKSLPKCLKGHGYNLMMSQAFWNVIP